MSGDSQSSGSSGNGGGENNGGENGDGGNGGGPGGPSTAEKIVMAISATFTVALFAFVIFQAMTTSTGVAPQASVVGTQPLADGSVAVAVRLTNPSSVGLQIATIEVGCTSPPREIQFQHVPADDYEIGHVVCPGGTTNPEASVSWWIET